MDRAVIDMIRLRAALGATCTDFARGAPVAARGDRGLGTNRTRASKVAIAFDRRAMTLNRRHRPRKAGDPVSAED